MSNPSADYLRYKADNYNCICTQKQIRKGIVSPGCDHCRLLCVATEIDILHRKIDIDRGAVIGLHHGLVIYDDIKPE